MLKRIAIAALVLVGVVALLFWVGRRERGQAVEARRESQLVAFDDRRVAAFTLEEGERRFRFERAGTEWKVVAPRPDPASAVAIDELFGALRGAKVLRTLPGEDALAQFGLDPPRHALRFEGADFPAVDVGDVDPTGSGVFVRVASRPGVQLVRLPEAKPLAQLAAERLRDRRLLGVPRSGIGAIALSRGGREVRLVRRDGGWWISAPREFPAADGAVDRLLEILSGAEAAAIDDAADAGSPALGLSGPGATEIRLSLGEQAHRLVIGPTGADGSAWATREDRVSPMRFQQARFERLPVAFDELRETRLTKLNRYAVVRVAWRAPEGELAAAREGETTWKGPSGDLLRGESIVMFLASAIDAPIAGWSEGTPPGAPEAVLEVEADGGRKERVEFFGNRTARVASVPGVIFRLAGDRPAYRP